MKVIYREDALRDLDQIFDWIAEDSPERARRTIARILSTVDGVMSAFPLSGRPVRQSGAVRCWPVPGLPYLVIYLPSDDRAAIDILNVIHAARDWNA
jgi:toxin ParE1/3/4